MKTKQALMSVCAAACVTAASATTPEVVWETLGNGVGADGKAAYVQRFTITTDTPFERLAFNTFKRPMQAVNPADTLIELLPGYFAVGSARFAAANGEPIVVEVETKGVLRNASYTPEGIHLVAGGKAVKAAWRREAFTSHPSGWLSPDGYDAMIYGPQAYEINDSLRSAYRPGPYMQIPTPKRVETARSTVAVPTDFEVVEIDDPRTDYYRVHIGAERPVVYTNSRHQQALVERLKRRISASATPDGRVPEADIEDWADLSYRGVMIDVARNFQTKADMERLIDLLARYDINTLHFHVGDDEAWRVEIPELPELTAVGSRRGYTTTNDVDYLHQMFCGDGDPTDPSSPANGYYTRQDYIDLLRYAYERGIDVIPEFDTPGHSRAAIRAMEYRYRTTGDDSLRLIHDGDTSTYTTAQNLHDNLMNPALEGPYRFWGIVFDSIIETYRQAGIPLKAIHIGGDEVPAHAWDGSAAAVDFMRDHGMTEQRQLHGHFVERVARLAADRGIKIAGWQEIARDHSAEYDAAVIPVVEAVNCWTNAGKFVPEMAAKGYPIILSNVDYLYFDQTPSTHPEEDGLTWGGIVDEFRPLHATVDCLCPASAEVQKNVYGISAHIFAETVRSRAMVERYLLPRLLGLAERAHHTGATLTDSQYFGYITSEMPSWAAEGLNVQLRQPGIRLNEGKVEMNDAYGLGEIRYTTDGSQPTAQSALYTAPFELPAGTTEVRAALFYGPSRSVTSILYK